MNKDNAAIGGAATTRGIWYQALWVVLQATSDRQKLFSNNPSNLVDGQIHIVLEPQAGDVRLENENTRRIVQLKTKHEGKWSLKAVIEDVLSDLYKAVEVDDDKAVYEFVTEGRLGDWHEARKFFQTLSGRLKKNRFQDVYATLDTVERIEFAHPFGEFWKSGDETERGLIDRIVHSLRGPEPQSGQTDTREQLEVVHS